MSRKNYLKDWRQTNQAMNEFLNSDITSEADMLSEQQINLLPSNNSNDDNNIANRSHNDVVEEISSNSETENSDTELSDIEIDSELLGDIESIAENTLAEELASWTVNNKITRVALNQLLAVLRKYNVGTLPKDSTSLLRKPQNVDFVEKCGGSYKYLGLANGITRVLNAVSYKSDQINLIVNTNGIPVFKSSNIQLWPILCMFGGIHLFLVAVYSGEKKPIDVNSFLGDFLQEDELLKKNQFDFQHKHYTVNITALVCDGPAWQFLKSIKSHNAY